MKEDCLHVLDKIGYREYIDVCKGSVFRGDWGFWEWLQFTSMMSFGLVMVFCVGLVLLWLIQGSTGKSPWE